MNIGYVFYIIITACLLLISGCGKDRGIGPVSEVQLGTEIDRNLVKIGESAFERKCRTCHRMDSKLIGSPLRGVTKNRTPEWIMNMILNPSEMIEKNDAARELFQQSGVRMSPQDVNENEARAILEYLRFIDSL